ncbi:autophagy protein [Tieghemiomyces parasiticus]|uniref:Autophagy protein n=1 Tax=Tieghemiomyces parasiticus TaxID=78921 RepID=A0A9W8ABL8_9FUNG|nr:autophagy protein [Tieghemiomyces parasiticus]
MEDPRAVQHPQCQECAEALLERLDKELQEAQRENDFYQQCSKHIRIDNLSVEEQKHINAEIKQQAERENVLLDTIEDLQRQYQDVVDEMRALEKEETDLRKEEDDFWNQENRFQTHLADFQNERGTINLQYDHLSNQLMTLQRTNVFDDTFRIVYDRPIATINGLRLGRLPSHSVRIMVEWTEINAAWGQTLFLLHTVARRLNLTFQHYRLAPLGSFSRVEKTEDDHASYELFGSGDFHFGQLLHNRRFDQAMVAFLNCLQQTGERIRHLDPRLQTPYPIHKDRVGGMSIKLQFGQEETWTKALKYTLVNCKWALAFAASHTPSVHGPEGTS